MVTYTRVTNLKHFKFVSKHFLEAPCFSKEEVLENYAIRYIEEPEDMFILMALGDEYDLVGFIVGWLEGENKAILAQLYSASYNEKNVAHTLNERFETWVKAVGVSRILVETARNKYGLASTYGYEFLSTKLIKEL